MATDTKQTESSKEGSTQCIRPMSPIEAFTHRLAKFDTVRWQFVGLVTFVWFVATPLDLKTFSLFASGLFG
jgi:hypothetical protein